MVIPGVITEPVGDHNFECTVQFLIEWVSDSEAAAREHLADHATGGGASLIAVRNHGVIGIVTIRWQSKLPRIQGPRNSPGHQLAVAGPFRRLGVATLLMDAAEDVARGRSVAILGITVGIFDKYGPCPAAPARVHSGWPGSMPWPGAAEQRSTSDHGRRSDHLAYQAAP